jgi:predicted alpha/beta superfamily hydrolase
LFDSYIVFDPGLWWNNEQLLKSAWLGKHSNLKKRLYIATSAEKGMAELADRFVEELKKGAPPGVFVHHEKMPDEKHSTIYHPAALKAFRSVFKPAADK